MWDHSIQDILYIYMIYYIYKNEVMILDQLRGGASIPLLD